MDELTFAFFNSMYELPQDIAFTYKSEIRNILTLKDGSIFPGAQPISLEPRRGLPEIVHNNYLLCEKTDGTRFILYIPIEFNDPDLSLDLAAYTTDQDDLVLPRHYFFIDREYNFRRASGLIKVKPLFKLLNLSESLITEAYTNPERKKELLTYFNAFTAMFDGELVADLAKGTIRDHAPTEKPTQLCYYLFDAMFFNGVSIAGQNLTQRLAVANALPEYFLHGKKGSLLLKTKHFYEKSEIEELFALLNISCRHSKPLLPHHSDGIIFTAVDEPYQPGTCQFIQKWKPLHQNTVDLLLQPVKKKSHILTPEEYETLERGIAIKQKKRSSGAEALTDTDRQTARRTQQIVQRLLTSKPSDKYIGRLFTAIHGLLDSAPIDVLSLEEKKYDALEKRSAEIRKEDKPGLIMEFYWDQERQIFTYSDVTDYLKAEYPELRPLFGSIEVERSRSGTWVGQKVRLDKILPNDKSVYESVCRAYNDHVDENDLIAILKGKKPLPQGGLVGKLNPYLLVRVHCPGYD